MLPGRGYEGVLVGVSK